MRLLGLFFWICSLLVGGQTQSTSPTEPSCLGCQIQGGRRVICSSGGLITFPNLPPNFQQTMEELILRNNGLTSVSVGDLVNYTILSLLVAAIYLGLVMGSIKINKMEIHPTARVVPTLTTVLSLILHSSAQQLCPTGCFGCQAMGVTTRIVCSGAGLTTFPQLPAAIQQTVRELALRSNSITTITATDFENFTSLEELDFSSNNLETIEPGSFDNARALNDLDLARNRLSNIPDDLLENNAIESLDLSQNRIQNISAATFTGVRSLSTINLHNNDIQRIPNGTFTDLGIIETLDLTNNSLICDCELRWLSQFRMDTPPLIFMAGTCDAPASLSGMALETLTEDQFVCDCIPGCVNGTCDMSVGECDCDDGYIGSNCSTECPDGSYGLDCLQNCTCVPEQESSPCDHVDGTCHCLPGYNGSSCELECSEGFYGQDCANECQCENEALCDFRTGSCNCTAGWMGQFCNITCLNGTYGPNCLQLCMCSPDHESSPCDHTDGTCYCEPNYTGRLCDILDCAEGFYGEDCTEECECQNGASCDQVTGECNCTAGWMGEACNETCTDGFYGRNCSQICNCIEKNQNRPCNRMNGECHCLSNYTGLRCEILTSTKTDSMETPTRSNRAAIIAGATIGSAFVLLLLIALVVIIAVTIQVLVTHVHKTRDLRLRVSPSQQFENQKQLQNVTNYDKSLGAPPPDEQIPPTEAEMTTETSADVEMTKTPLP